MRIGEPYENSYIENLLNKNNSILNKNFEVTNVQNKKELCKKVALDIYDEKVVGWFQGKMEWGARALGNRSILADPRSNNMKEILNLKIKRRESFRPFAPSILQEHVKNWFR